MMAELILTEDEKRLSTYFEWDDETLGKVVKRVAQICQDNDGKRSVAVTGAAIFMISEAINSGAESYIIELENATDDNNNLGNWRITLENLT
jgi:hypothetical protein